MDYFAAPLSLLGVYLLGKKNVFGWVSSGAGSGLWVAYAAFTDQWPLLFLNIAFLALDSRGLYLWTQEDSDG